MTRLHARPTLDPSLVELLTYCRPHGSATEQGFVDRYLMTLPGAVMDPHGNVHVTVGAPDILWSCHTDTVHREAGRQRLSTDGIWIQLAADSPRNCLGADDTAGVYLCLHMIAAGRSGHYIFHRGEERGGIGSSALAQHTPDLIAGHRFAIALDRAGDSDIVTHQCGQRCCSEVFADSLSAALAPTFTQHDAYRATTGVYTDTHEYRHLIPECTNLSVGYAHAHSARERVNVTHVHRLLTALIGLRVDVLVCDRSPDDPDPVPVPRGVTDQDWWYPAQSYRYTTK